MDKLELKDIAGYLPYGLKCQDTSGNKIVLVDERCDLSPYLLSYFSDALIVSENGLISPYQVVRDEKIKPILFPMKCLIEEVAINGGTFVPIIELAKLFHKEDAYKVTHYEDPRYMDWGYSGEDAAWVINCCVENDSYRYLYYSIYKHKLNELPLNLADKLNELHFDYRGLIERGLAVSALDYDNPYK